MNPERWQQIKAALHEALELDSEKRRAFIDAIAAGDSELRTELESLLSAHDHAHREFPECPGRGPARHADQGPLDGGGTGVRRR